MLDGSPMHRNNPRSKTVDGSPMHRGLIATQPIEMVVECVTGGGAWEMNGDWYCLPSILPCTLRFLDQGLEAGIWADGVEGAVGLRPIPSFGV